MLGFFSSRFYSSSSAKQSLKNIQVIYNSLSSIINLQHSIYHPASCSNLQSCMKSMNSLTLVELGLRKDLSSQLFHQSVCMEIHREDNFSLAVFILPAGSRLPIHDHPQMCVLSKLVEGSLSYRSYSSDKTSKNEILYDCIESIKTHNDPTWFLTPDNGNYHELIALETCVLFDALLPPYEEDERSCSYYQAKSVSQGKWKLIKLKEEPHDLLPHGVPYHGDLPIPAR